MNQGPGIRTLLLTLTALVAFAANSVLCRMGLGRAAIDAGSFTAVRLGSGAATLLLLAALSSSSRPFRLQGSWISALMLFSYAVAFSFAYLSLSAGTGALILFCMVQLTMIFWALRSGERPRPVVWLGFTLALTGLVFLLLPGLSAPSPRGALLMSLAGVAWGIYSLRGRGVADPLGNTAGNFIRTLPFSAVVVLAASGVRHLSTTGVLLAIASGAIASGLGYVVWYAALRSLSTMRAAIVQLSVPVIAAGGGVLVLSETITVRLVVATVLILGGVAMAVSGRQ